MATKVTLNYKYLSRYFSIISITVLFSHKMRLPLKCEMKIILWLNNTVMDLLDISFNDIKNKFSIINTTNFAYFFEIIEQISSI